MTRRRQASGAQAFPGVGRETRPVRRPDRLASPGQAVWTALACAAILAAGIAAWSNSFNGPLIFDDLPAIRDNPTLRHFPAWENLVPPQSNPLSRRPVVNLTFALNCAMGGLDVRGFHAGNLLIHLLAALAFFGILRRTFLAPPFEERFGRAASALAFAPALIWTVHPLLTESVTYLTQRTESLMGLFCLLTLYCVIRGASGGRPWRWYAAAIASCALGMGSKEVMAAAPILILLYDRCFLSGSFREALRRRWALYLGLAAAWVVLGALLIAYPWGGGTGAGFGMAEVGPWEYARTQPAVILHYLRLSLWPRSLCLDYAWPAATGARQILPPAVVIGALLAGTLWALRRAPALGFLGAGFFLILAPSSSFVPIIKEIAAERRMYLPLAAVVTACVVAAWRLGDTGVRHVAESAGARKLFGSVLAAVTLLAVSAALGCRTFERNALYRNAISLWQDTADKRPRNPGAQNNLGAAYLQAGRPDEAIRCFSKAIELAPEFFEACNNRAAAYTLTGRIAEALRDYDKAIALRPDSADVYDNRGNARLLNNQPAEAIPDCDKAIALRPDFAEAYNTRASAYLRTGRFGLALRDCDRAIALKPAYAGPYLNRASAHDQMKEYDRALADLKRYRQLGGQPPPGYLEALQRAAGRLE
jgi:tetratricopeptide (TPR) repeat protein